MFFVIAVHITSIEFSAWNKEHKTV